jgi:Flp pilus assembly secretin CpaC
MASSYLSRGLLPIALAIALGGMGIISPAAVAADIVINPNEDLIVKLPPRVATIVVGNPLMVDVSLAAPGFMVMTAKSYGGTNIIFLDRAGNVLMEPSILVRGKKNDDDRVVYKGVKRDDPPP